MKIIIKSLLYLVLSIVIISEFLSLGHLFSSFLLALVSGYSPPLLLCLSIWFLIVLTSIVLIVRVLVVFTKKLTQQEGLPDRIIKPLLKTKNIYFLLGSVVLVLFAIFVTARGWKYGVFFDSLGVVNPVTAIVHRIEVMLWIADLVVVLCFQLKRAKLLIQK